MLGNSAASVAPTQDLLQRLEPDAIIVHTKQGFDRLRGTGVDASKLLVVPHPPLSLAVSPRTAIAPAAETSAVEFAMIGEVKAYKGYDTVFRAFAALPDELVPRVRLRVAGRPFFDIEALRDEILPSDRRSMVHLELRYLSEEEFAYALERCACLLLPYREIEASGVLFVALERAKMILASRVGAFGEILPDDFLVPVGDHTTLARKIAEFAKASETWPTRTQQLREIAQQHLTNSEFEVRLLDAFTVAKQNYQGRIKR
jgi:glycosyltransferase involved in cell wall biosynthesis